VAVTFDQKQFINAGSDCCVTNEFQIRTERAAYVTVDHCMNNDTFCKLILYAMWLMPAVAIGVAIAAWEADFEGFVKMLESKDVYDRNEFDSECSGVARNLCYIHGGKGILPDVCERETLYVTRARSTVFALTTAIILAIPPAAPRRSYCIFATIQRALWTRFYCFCNGIDIFFNDRDIVISDSPAGKCSTDSPGEKVVGAMS
jgi:hypothetical protein